MFSRPMWHPGHKHGNLGGKSREKNYRPGTRLVKHTHLQSYSARSLTLVFHQPDIHYPRPVPHSIAAQALAHPSYTDIGAKPAIFYHGVFYP